MKRFLVRLARRVEPGFEDLPEGDQLRLLRELFGVLYALPFLFISLIWLIAISDWALLRAGWPLVLLFALLALLLSRINYFQIVGTESGSLSTSSSNLSGVVLISAYLVLGPTAIWIKLATEIVFYGVLWRRFWKLPLKLNLFRNLMINMGLGTLAALLALALYQRLGGNYPISSSDSQSLFAAVVAVLVMIPLNVIGFVSWGYFVDLLGIAPEVMRDFLHRIGSQTMLFIVLGETPSIFGILGALLLVDLGLGAYLFFAFAIFLVSILARQLSRAVVISQQRTQELVALEKLGRAIIAAPAYASALPRLLEEYLPQMLSYDLVEIRLEDGHLLVHLPADAVPVVEQAWAWFWENPQDISFGRDAAPPWGEDAKFDRVFLTPIHSVEGNQVLGGIYLMIDEYQYVDVPIDMTASLQVLAAQIASALHSAQVYAQNLAHEKVAQELAFAGEIQASFLPQDIPQIEGLDLTATLLPARETAGDFFDLIELPDGKLGIVVADVTDKGVGAALYMALCRTLLRSYALEYPADPARVFAVTNTRILADAYAGLFVTAFYGVLDPATGDLSYANGGQNPPLLFSGGNPDRMQELTRTGVPLGLFEESVWETHHVRLDQNSLLVLYTDGLTEAHNDEGEMFGQARLVSALRPCLKKPLEEIQSNLLATVKAFSEGQPQGDDLTLLLLARR